MFFGRFKHLEIFLKKVAERSRDSGRRSRDRRLTVKQRFWTFQAIRKLFVKTHRRVTRQWSVVTRLSADCQAHICMYIIINERERERESEREREKERESEWERERPNTNIRQKKITPTIFPFVDSGPISLGFSRESPARDMWCFVAYVYSGREIEREKERESERDREREIERERERETEYYVAFGRRIADEEAKIRQKNLPDNFRVCWLLPHLSRFFTGISRRICDTTSPMFIMGNLFPSWGSNELEFSRQNQKFSLSHP